MVCISHLLPNALVLSDCLLRLFNSEPKRYFFPSLSPIILSCSNTSPFSDKFRRQRVANVVAVVLPTSELSQLSSTFHYFQCIPLKF